MVVDTSALVAILFNEPDAEDFEDALDRSERRLISAVSVLETSMVLESRYGEIAGHELDLLIYKLPIEIRPADSDQLHWARRAFRMYGRGRHPAGLNFGDCFSYALARSTGEPLLFKGDDFSKTDLVSALINSGGD
jgi:ribonuclease VapC